MGVVRGYFVREPISANAGRGAPVTALCRDRKAWLSIDTNVWWLPDGLYDTETVPAWSFASMWYSWDALIRAAGVEAARRGCIFGAITASESDARLVDYLPVAEPAALEPGQWELLGYDVADNDLYSHVAGIGMPPEIGPEAWSQFINEVHLFRDLEDARRFSAHLSRVAGRHLASHLPAIPFGVWRRASMPRGLG